MRRIKKMVCWMLCFLCVAACFGCGSKKEEGKSGGSAYEYDPNKKVELSGTFELQVWSGGYGAKPWEEIIAAFEEEHPELDVVAYIDVNVNKKMQTRWMKGNPPDFIVISGPNIPTQTLKEEGKFLDLSSFFEKATIAGTDDLIKDHIASNSFKYEEGNRIYTAPTSVECYSPWYDETFFNAQGMKVPTNFDELLAFGQTAKQKGIPAIIYPGQSPMYLVHSFVFPAIAAAGGQEYLDRITTAADVEAYRDPILKEALTRVDTMAKAGMFAEGTVSLNNIQSQMQWLNNKAFIIPNGLWLEQEMKSDIPDGFKMRFAAPMMNAANEKQVIVTSTGGVAVASEGDNKEAALEFLRFMYRDENMAKFTKYWGTPIVTDADLSSIDLSDTAKQAQEMLLNDAYTHVDLNFSWGSVDAVMCDVINRIVLQEMTVDEAIDELAATVEKQLKK